MNEKSNLFKTSLSFPVFESYNTAIFHLLHTPKYKNYTDVVLSSLGLEIEKYLKPEDFTLKYRYKSKKSFFQNLSQDSKVVNNEISSNFNKFIPYDIIGMRLVIKNVPEDFQISNHFIENSKKKLELIKQELYKLKTIPSYTTNGETLDKEIVAKYRQLDSQMHYLTNCINFKNILSKRNLIKQDIETIDKNLNSNPNDLALLNERYTAHNLLGNLNKMEITITEAKLTPSHLAELIKMVEDKEISSQQAKGVFTESLETGKSPHDIASEKGLKQITDEGEIVKVANEVLDENPDVINQYKNGKTNMVNYLVGQVMKKTGGKANPSLARDVMAKEIEKR